MSDSEAFKSFGRNEDDADNDGDGKEGDDDNDILEDDDDDDRDDDDDDDRDDDDDDDNDNEDDDDDGAVVVIVMRVAIVIQDKNEVGMNLIRGRFNEEKCIFFKKVIIRRFSSHKNPKEVYVKAIVTLQRQLSVRT